MSSDTETRKQILETLERFNQLVSAKNRQVLAEFAPGDETLLIGSEVGEVAKGSQELEAFFTRIFAREVAFSWEWDRIDVSHSGNLAWFFAEGRVLLSGTEEQRRSASGQPGRKPGRNLRWQIFSGRPSKRESCRRRKRWLEKL